MTENSSEFIIIKDVLVSYKGAATSIEVPYGVSCIGEEAFSYQNVRRVCIPDTVKIIGDSAFSHCERLCEVKLPESLLNIGREAFSSCICLSDISIPSNLKTIGTKAFANCWRLTKIELPDTISEIGSGAFASTGIEEIIIPNEVAIINDNTFASCRQLRRVVLPGKLKAVGWRSFYNCRELSDISFPETLLSIGEEAFEGCNRIVDENGFIIINNVLSYYYGNERVVAIPDGVRHINDRVFHKKRRIVKIILPVSITSIGKIAFSECPNLRQINITSKITKIDRSAFNDCKKLADDNGFIIFNNILFRYYGHFAEVKIPDRVEIIGEYSFNANDAIERVIIPESVNVIERKAFFFCSYLKEVVMPEQMSSIYEGAFQSCEKLKSITIPNGVDTLEFNTFNDCDSLEEIILPKTLKKIGYRAITDCRSLEKFSIPECVEAIGGGQFDNCDNLSEISIPESVISFDDCDLKGRHLNFFKLGREFRVTLMHRWDARDERLFWEMLNNPSIETFTSIKTASYKIALAEKLYPEYKEYGPYLKKNIGKAINDAVFYNDNELLCSLRSSNLIEEAKFNEAEMLAREEKRKKIEDEYKRAETAILNENIINIYYLKRVSADLERVSEFRDVSDLLQKCSERIARIEENRKEEKYKQAIKTMNEFGGMSWLTLEEAIKQFRGIQGYKEADSLARDCKIRLETIFEGKREDAYQNALTLYSSHYGSHHEELEKAIDIFEALSGYKDSEDKIINYYRKYWNIEIKERRQTIWEIILDFMKTSIESILQN